MGRLKQACRLRVCLTPFVPHGDAPAATPEDTGGWADRDADLAELQPRSRRDLADPAHPGEGEGEGEEVEEIDEIDEIDEDEVLLCRATPSPWVCRRGGTSGTGADELPLMSLSAAVVEPRARALMSSL